MIQANEVLIIVSVQFRVSPYKRAGFNLLVFSEQIKFNDFFKLKSAAKAPYEHSHGILRRTF